MGDLSEHFRLLEFRCKGHGRRGHRAHPTQVSGQLVAALERLRARTGGRALTIVSGHRCAWWNRQVGGARRSKHLSGLAADIPEGYATVAQAAAAGFTGVGHRGRWAVHVDVRPGAFVLFED